MGIVILVFIMFVSGIQMDFFVVVVGQVKRSGGCQGEDVRRREDQLH